jgi:hypothetical protein
VELLSRWRRWLVHRGGGISVAFGLEHGGHQMLGSDS